MQQDPKLWFPAPSKGFPLCPGRREELEKNQNGDVDGGRIGVSPSWPLRTPIQTPTKNNTKTQNPQRNRITQNPQKNRKNTKYK